MRSVLILKERSDGQYTFEKNIQPARKYSFCTHGLCSATETKNVMKKILYDTSLSQATFYYRFYLNRAFKESRYGRYVLFAT
jgi:hypothetical protein